MITCPWCGTSYTAFQSNCRNCGGPMPLPEKTAQPQHEPALPPMAPRSISDSFAWKLLLTDGWAIAAFVFLLLGGIFAITGILLTLALVTAFVGIPFAVLGVLFLIAGGIAFQRSFRKARTTVRVLREGAAARGRIESVDMNYSVRVNGRHPWIIGYGFQLNGKNYQGQVTTLNQPGPQLEAGHTAYILYLPETPEANALYPHP